MQNLSELNQEFQKTMKRLQFGVYSGRTYMDMKQIFIEGYLLGTEDRMGLKKHEDPKQLEMF